MQGFPRENYSVRRTGKIEAPDSGEFEFLARGDDGYRVWLDGKLIIDEWRQQAAFDARKIVKLEKGKSYSVKVEYFQGGGDAEMHFAWQPVVADKYAKEREAAQNADVAIVCIGLRPEIEGEGRDRPYSLPAGEDELVENVLKVNPRTIVVLNGGGGMDMHRWVDRVPALVMAWYPGQDGNKALAEILFGDISPSGKLPITIEKRWEDSPAYGNYPGVNHRVHYAEGIFVGYRWFEHKNIKPLFPFGFGLSYSTFKYSGLKTASDREVWSRFLFPSPTRAVGPRPRLPRCTWLRTMHRFHAR